MTEISSEVQISEMGQSVSVPTGPVIEKLGTKEETIPPVFKEVLRKTQDILTNFRTDKLEANRLAVVVSAYDAKELLPETLREITEQIRKARLQGEIFVILNNGGGNTTEYVNAGMQSEQIDKVKEELGVDGIVFGKTEELTETAPNSKALPRKITTKKPISDVANGINLFVIEQQQGTDNPGKIRGLRDMYEHLRVQNHEEGYCPQYLLAIDAETRIRPVDKQRKQIQTDVNSGLSHMVSLSDGGRKMVGAKLQFVPYDGNGNPNWRERTPPMQEATSIMHGMRGYEWLPGGGHLEVSQKWFQL